MSTPRAAGPAGLEPVPPLPRSVLWFVLALYAVCAGAAVLTRDFGLYFDDKLHAGALRVTFETGIPLPRTYHYPSFTYVLSLLAALPSWAAHGFRGGELASELSRALEAKLVDPPRALLDARALFALVAHLSLFWTALLAWRLSRSRVATCLAAATLALSFEFHYHARIWSPDAPMAQFVVLAVLFAHRWFASATRREFLCAAVAAGLAAGTKFPGALALAGVGVAALAIESRRSATRGEAFRRALPPCFLALAVTLAVFLLTTPGVIFDWDLVRKDVSMELRHYQAEGMAGPHAPYDVHAGGEFLGRLGVYLAAQGLSYSVPFAIGMFALAVVGWVVVARRERIGAAVVFAVPLVYVAYFSFQRLMVVRNFELLLPFLALGVGCGVAGLWAPRAPRILGAGAALLAGAVLAFNAAFLVRADRSILDRRTLVHPAAVREFLASRAEPVFLGKHARALLDPAADADLLARSSTDDPRAAKLALVMPDDLAEVVKRPGFSVSDLRANWPWLYQPLRQGPWEVNFSYYPTWIGDARPLRISTEYYCVLAGIH